MPLPQRLWCSNAGRPPRCCGCPTTPQPLTAWHAGPRDRLLRLAGGPRPFVEPGTHLAAHSGRPVLRIGDGAARPGTNLGAAGGATAMNCRSADSDPACRRRSIGDCRQYRRATGGGRDDGQRDHRVQRLKRRRAPFAEQDRWCRVVPAVATTRRRLRRPGTPPRRPRCRRSRCESAMSSTWPRRRWSRRVRSLVAEDPIVDESFLTGEVATGGR